MHFFYRLCVCLLLLVACPGPIDATTISSSQNGNWSTTSTWQGGVVPMAGDTVLILAGDTVTLTDIRSCAVLHVHSQAQFNLNQSLGGYTSVVNDGVRLQHKQISGNVKSIDISDLPPGIFLLKLSTGQHEEVHRLVKS